ncbi:MAG: GDP-L-fucose synthase [Rhodothermales bacterium]|nr:GDP-L-fucose synthase [Rhodothermales bacterium]MBO6780954.1 GDP-L-fucose synthase [Rhodothermales bacterium]
MNLTDKGSRIYVAGHRGLVGGAVQRALEAEGFSEVIARTSAELDLRQSDAVQRFFEAEMPEYVVVAAAKVGGILANDTYPADFLYDNLAIQTNVIRSAFESGVKRLVFLGSTCIYPKMAPQPLKEEYLLTAPLEPTNEWYAIAKIAGVKYCEALRKQHGADFVSLMPTNLYGPGDNFDLKTSHVLPALIRKFHEARETGGPVVLWGTGTPRREFLYVDDVASAVLHVLRTPEEELHAAAPGGLLNIGVGDDIEIRELASLIADVVGYEGEIEHDLTKPDGTPRKLVHVGRLHALGWKARVGLREGVERTYRWFLENEA